MNRGYLSHTRRSESGTEITCEFVDLDTVEPESARPSRSVAAGEVELDVSWSALNYKDALLLAGRPGVSRREWLVPGIDVVGRVRESRSPHVQPGDEVLLNGGGLGETRDGGLAERCILPGDDLLRIPAPFSAQDAGSIGTAGFTAALAVNALRREISRDSGDVLVTGAAGGVGSIAIALLSELGYHVIASTGRYESEAGYLHGLGASTIIDRAELGTEVGRPLQSVRWAGAIDTVGSTTLSNVLAATGERGLVVACGLAQGPDLPSTVMPFILRAVALRGINSGGSPLPVRRDAWELLSAHLDRDLLTSLTEVIALDRAAHHAQRLLRGDVRGRIAVQIG